MPLRTAALDHDPAASGCADRPRASSAAPTALFATALATLLAACATDEPVPVRSAMTHAEARALIVQALPPGVGERAGWAADIHAALTALQVPVNASNVCAAVAITEQESSFRANPTVPGLAAIAWREIDAKSERAGVPPAVARTALKLPSSNGRSFAERIDAATTEKELSEIFDDFVGMVPMGRRLFAGANPVRTGGPMQVAIAFAEQHAAARPYPYPVATDLRAEVFTRRGGLYFGIAHLLDYPADYDRPLYRFADFNAGHYASRNAAFQNAVSIASGIALDLDGDLVLRGPDAGRRTGATEAALRSLAPRLGLDQDAIRAALAQEKEARFARSAVYRKVFEAAEQAHGRPLPRAVVPRIQLKSPKITRQLTTEWFATRVDERHRRCVVRVNAQGA